MVLNDAGKMIQKWWLALEGKFSNMVCDEYIVMPDHFHGIIAIDNSPTVSPFTTPVGTDLFVCPENKCVCLENIADKHVGLSLLFGCNEKGKERVGVVY